MCFAVLAPLKACAGFYGTMSYNAARQIGEIRTRMSLGATRRSGSDDSARVQVPTVGFAISVPAALKRVQAGDIVTVRHPA